MKTIKIGYLLVYLFAGVPQVGSAAPGPDGTIKIDGSSTVYLITEAAAEDFQKLKGGRIRIPVQISGTSGGFRKFCTGETDIQNASRPILTDELALCRKNGVQFYELPIAFDATAIVVHPRNTWVSSITTDELKKMWGPAAQGKVSKWNQINNSWPQREFKLYGAGGDSGTFDYFTEAINGKARSSRSDYGQSEDDYRTAASVASHEEALGYLPFAYYEHNKDKLKLLGVQGGAKAPKASAVLPSRETVADGSYFPLSRPIFIYVAAAAAQRPLVKEFVEYYLKESERLVADVRYMPLPREAYAMILRRFREHTLGTGFHGVAEIGLKTTDIMSRQPKM